MNAREVVFPVVGVCALWAMSCVDAPTVSQDPWRGSPVRQAISINFTEFGSDATLIDFEGLGAQLEGTTIGLVTFRTFNDDNGSFLIELEPASGNFPAHSPTHLALKGDGFNQAGGSNAPPPIIEATFAVPVGAVGAWLTSPSQQFFTAIDAAGTEVGTTTLDPISPREPRFVGFSSPSGIARVLIGNNQIGGFGFDDFVYADLLLTPAATIEDVIDQISEVLGDEPSHPATDDLGDAASKLQRALDALGETPPDRLGALRWIERGIGDVQEAVSRGLLDEALGTEVMVRLAEVARGIAVAVIDEAIARAGHAEKISEAQTELAEGDALRDLGDFRDAVDKYKDALKVAERA